MASKPLKPCAKAGCPNLTRERYCAAHTAAAKLRKASADWHSWYALPVWKHDLRVNQLLQEPFCRACAAKGERTKATEVDHVIPHRGCWSRFIDRHNLQSLCHTCHSRKTMQELQKSLREM